ncbi:Fusaric acid resistance protein-like-domain-containing protein [Coniochaeta sp. 2T2.1]|nr:Fusaric acid resistance protein-like-domain-containing protein [Coniochaeta sp. 2T2.1]
MTPSATPANTGQWPPRRPSQRSKLRNGSFIIPTTGERSHRTFTLRRGNGSLDGPNDANNSSNGLGSSGVLPSRQSLSERWSNLLDNTKSGTRRFAMWLNSPMGRGILKCTLAYTLASLATFLGPVSDFLGKPDGKHVVATITVYFHPARTAGSMIEAILIAIVAISLHQPTTAHALVLMVFVAGGFGFIGWIKQKLNNPLVNVGSTLASLAIIGVVTKENAVLSNVFSNQKIVQILKMLVMGIATTTFVNLLVWRVSAVSLLRGSMNKASISLGDMLSMISRGFLNGSEEELLSAEFSTASAAYGSVYSQMTKNLREAKFERYFLGRERMYQLDRAVVRSMETLAQSIGGLRSAANTQFALLKEAPDADVPSGTMSPRGGTVVYTPTLNRKLSSTLRSGHDRLRALSAIDEASDESTEEERSPPARRPSDTPEAPPFNCPSDIFELFIALLGPSMKSLAYTLSEILREPAFGSAPDYQVTVNMHFRDSLTSALGLFNDARANALQELYTNLEFGRNRTEKIQADFEEVAAACGHFSFSLQTFGEEMQKYLDVLDDLKHASQLKKRSWRWLLGWWRRDDGRRSYLTYPRLPYEPEESQSLIKPIKKTALPKGIPDSMIRRRDTYAWNAAPSAVNTIVASVSQSVLRMIRKLARDDIRFGVKVGIGASLWAMFAFIPSTRDTYQHWRGEWGLLSFMIVCSMTVGAANTTGWSRFVGTVIGATASVINWNLTGGNAVGLICLGYIVSFWAFWMIVAKGQAPLGRITLLAYNVSTLYAYSLSQKVDDDDDDEGGVSPLILEIVKHRAISVTAGILWGLIVCRLIWPISARKKFKEGLSVLYLQMGLIWKRGPLAILLRSHCSRSYLKSGEQAALQKYAARLDALRQSAKSEFELRGPFPYEPTGRLMAATNRILDAFYAMSLVTQRKGHLTDGERALLRFTATERAMLCDRICHVFQVLASSLMLEYPLTDAIPSVTNVRDRLLGKIFLFRKENQRQNAVRDKEDGGVSSARRDREEGNRRGGMLEVVVEEKDYALLYAYALVTGQVAEQLKLVEREIEGLFGVLDEDAVLLQ